MQAEKDFLTEYDGWVLKAPFGTSAALVHAGIPGRV